MDFLAAQLRNAPSLALAQLSRSHSNQINPTQSAKIFAEIKGSLHTRPLRLSMMAV
jgi:hypothetical protein